MELEATPGIEPGYTDLQSAASPLRHVALGSGYLFARTARRKVFPSPGTRIVKFSGNFRSPARATLRRSGVNRASGLMLAVAMAAISVSYRFGSLAFPSGFCSVPPTTINLSEA